MRALVEAARCATAVVEVAGVVKDCTRYQDECRRESIEGYLQSLKLVYGMLSPVCAQSSSGCQPSEMSFLTSLGEQVSTSESHRMRRTAYLGQSADPISVSVL